MKIVKVLMLFAVAIAMTAVFMTSGCVEEMSDITEGISEIGSKDYQETFIKGEKRQIAVDSEYALLLKRVSFIQSTSLDGEAVVEIFSNNISIGQKTLTIGFGGEVSIKRLTLELVSIDRYRQEYVEIKITERVDVVGYGQKTIGAVGDIAKSVADTQS